VNCIYEGLRVVDIAPSKTPKTLHHQRFSELIFIRPRTGLALEEVRSLVLWCVSSGIIVLLKLEFSRIHDIGVLGNIQ
jgi:hypothetical protein